MHWPAPTFSTPRFLPFSHSPVSPSSYTASPLLDLVSPTLCLILRHLQHFLSFNHLLCGLTIVSCSFLQLLPLLPSSISFSITLACFHFVSEGLWWLLTVCFAFSFCFSPSPYCSCLALTLIFPFSLSWLSHLYFNSLSLGVRAYRNRCLCAGNIAGFGRKFFQCSD